MATLRQKKVVEKIAENIRSQKPKTKGRILREVGYSEDTSKRPSQVLESQGVKKELKPFLDKLVAHREKIIKAMDKKNLSKEQYKVLSDALQKFNHDIQLLSGGSTERFDLLDKEQLDDLLARRAKKAVPTR